MQISPSRVKINLSEGWNVRRSKRKKQTRVDRSREVLEATIAKEKRRIRELQQLREELVSFSFEARLAQIRKALKEQMEKEKEMRKETSKKPRSTTKKAERKKSSIK